MLGLVICTNKDCVNKDVEYLIPDQIEPAMCGGCKDFILPVETDISAPELLPYIPYITEEL